MALTGGHASDIEYIAESSYGDGLPTSGQLQIPSDSILSIDLNPNPITERHFTVSDHDAIGTSHHAREYVLTIEYKLQRWLIAGAQHTATTNLEYYSINRTAHQLASLAFVYKVGDAYYLLKGGKANSVAYGNSINETIRMSVEYWGNGMQTGTGSTDFTNYSSLDAASAHGNAFDVYGGSAVTRSGMFAAGIKSSTFTINNNLERVPTQGSQDASAIREGHIIPSISCEILADAGGKVDIDDLLASGSADVVYDTGTTTSKSQKLTFTAATYDSAPIVYRVDDTHIIIGADLGAEAVTLAAYS